MLKTQYNAKQGVKLMQILQIADYKSKIPDSQKRCYYLVKGALLPCKRAHLTMQKRHYYLVKMLIPYKITSIIV